MQILISNDDGVNAPGIRVLAKALSSLATIHVVAPDRDRSAASNSLTIDNPLRVVELENGHFAVNGTPTDCVHMAITSLLAQRPDMVVSGINAGANLGDDVLYSGTVAAAMEGRFLGYPTIAMSLVSKTHHVHTYYETAGEIAAQLVRNIIAHPLSKDIILNVNVPDVPLSEIKGIKITRLGYRHRAEQMVTSKDPRGNTLYWIGAPGPGADAGPGTDFYAVEEGYVSITPLKTDLTNFQELDNLSKWITL